MSDILKVTAPLIDKNNIQAQKPHTDPSVPFKLGDIPVVPKAGQQSEILKQSNTLINKDTGSALLTGMLKDPSVTVHYLTSIFMLEEIVGLLPLNNSPQTGNIEKLLMSVLISSNEITNELLKQENCSTDFKGTLFNFLRELSAKTAGTGNNNLISHFLKALNGAITRENSLNSISNNILCLSDMMSPSNELSSRLKIISQAFLKSNGSDFENLKNNTALALKDCENSILYNPKAERLISTITYNLSRFQNNVLFFRDSFKELYDSLNSPEEKLKFSRSLIVFLLEKTSRSSPNQKEYLLKCLDSLLAGGNEQLRKILKKDISGLEFLEKEQGSIIKDDSLRETLLTLSQDKSFKNNNSSSKVMSALSDILANQNESMKALNSEKLNKILSSLLSSPSNFTPLLHFIIPVRENEKNSFAEFWINPNDKDDDNEKAKSGIHMLINFEIADAGRFEAELWCQDKKLSFALFCPPKYKDYFVAIKEPIKKTASSFGYSFQNINIDELLKPRTLIEVFKTLPLKRSGINVKI